MSRISASTSLGRCRAQRRGRRCCGGVLALARARLAAVPWERTGGCCGETGRGNVACCGIKLTIRWQRAAVSGRMSGSGPRPLAQHAPHRFRPRSRAGEKPACRAAASRIGRRRPANLRPQTSGRGRTRPLSAWADAASSTTPTGPAPAGCAGCRDARRPPRFGCATRRSAAGLKVVSTSQSSSRPCRSSSPGSGVGLRRRPRPGLRSQRAVCGGKRLHLRTAVLALRQPLQRPPFQRARRARWFHLLSASPAGSCGMPTASRTLFSISRASSGFSRRNSRALSALADLLAVVGVPGAALLEDLVVHAYVDHLALAADALP